MTLRPLLLLITLFRLYLIILYFFSEELLFGMKNFPHGLNLILHIPHRTFLNKGVDESNIVLVALLHLDE